MTTLNTEVPSNVGQLLCDLENELVKKGYSIQRSDVLRDCENMPHPELVDFVAENKNEVQLHFGEGIESFIDAARAKMKRAKEIYMDAHANEQRVISCYLNGEELKV
jgi:hypothetical protein